MENIILEIGKTYKTRNGTIVTIEDGLPPINGQLIGWNGIYHGKVNNTFKNFLFNGKNHEILSQFSSLGSCRDISNKGLDIIEEIK